LSTHLGLGKAHAGVKADFLFSGLPPFYIWTCFWNKPLL